MSFSVPTAAPFTCPSTVSSVLPENGGTSGIIIDNTTDWTEIRELITDSYRLLAPKKLTALLDE